MFRRLHGPLAYGVQAKLFNLVALTSVIEVSGFSVHASPVLSAGTITLRIMHETGLFNIMTTQTADLSVGGPRYSLFETLRFQGMGEAL